MRDSREDNVVVLAGLLVQVHYIRLGMISDFRAVQGSVCRITLV